MSLPAAKTATAPLAQPPDAHTAARPRKAFATTTAAATVAAAALSWDRPGLGWPLTALVVVSAVALTVRGRRRDAQTAPGWSGQAFVWAAAAGTLLAVGAIRAAGWLFVLCVLTAGLIGCAALFDRWTISDVLLAPLRVAGRLPAALRWLASGAIPASGKELATFVRTLISAMIAVALLLVFGFLLTTADAAFAQLLSHMLPSVDSGTVLRWTCSAALAVAVTATAAHARLTGALQATEDKSRPRPVRRLEWALPVAGLLTLFTAFVAVQANVLFGGGDHVLTTAGLTYAQYARSGFWQLLTVTGLTVVVVSVTARIAPRSTTADRVLLRALLGPLSALTLVIVASALSRMAAYEQAYGFTRQRLLVTACELWLGMVFLLILAAGIRLRGRWVPQAALAAGVGALLGLATLNPDAFIARQNIARFAETGSIDLNYLKTLSADAVPTLQTLPEPYRSCALTAIDHQLAAGRPDTWYEWNLGRDTARTHLHSHPPGTSWCTDESPSPTRH